jgi:hypothetical protein
VRVATKKTITRKLDKVCSELVRARGYCVKCGETKNLQCCHIISRSHRATRWLMDNLLCLCANCHINFAHKNPILFADFCRNYLGDTRYSQLTMMGTMIKKWQLCEMIELYEQLKKERER